MELIHLQHFEAQSETLTMSLLFKSRKGFTMVSYDNDIDTAMKVHLLQAIHQLTDDVIDLPQRVVQLWAEMNRKKEKRHIP